MTHGYDSPPGEPLDEADAYLRDWHTVRGEPDWEAPTGRHSQVDQPTERRRWRDADPDARDGARRAPYRPRRARAAPAPPPPDPDLPPRSGGTDAIDFSRDAPLELDLSEPERTPRWRRRPSLGRRGHEAEAEPPPPPSAVRPPAEAPPLPRRRPDDPPPARRPDDPPPARRQRDPLPGARRPVSPPAPPAPGPSRHELDASGPRTDPDAWARPAPGRHAAGAVPPDAVHAPVEAYPPATRRPWHPLPGPGDRGHGRAPVQPLPDGAPDRRGPARAGVPVPDHRGPVQDLPAVPPPPRPRGAPPVPPPLRIPPTRDIRPAPGVPPAREVRPAPGIPPTRDIRPPLGVARPVGAPPDRGAPPAARRGDREEPGGPESGYPVPAATGPGRARALRLALPRSKPWLVVLIAVLALVLVATCGAGAYFMIAGDRQASVSRGAGLASTDDPTRRDISSRVRDPAPLTEQEVFPAKEIVPDPSQGPYRLARTQSSADCAVAATGDLGAILVRNGCSQVVRGTAVSPDGGYIVTAGMYNLSDESGAAQVHAAVEGIVNAQKGRFTGFAAGGATDVIARSATQLGWNYRGHYLFYCVIARADGKPLASNDPNGAKIVNDIVKLYLGGTVIDHRVTMAPPGPSGTAAPAGRT